MQWRAISWVVVFACLLLLPGCKKADKLNPAENTSKGAKVDLRLAVLTDLQGAIEPCGCTSDPLGGVDRLATALDEKARQDSIPTLLLLSGDSFFRETKIEAMAIPQERSRANTLAKILTDLNVSAVGPGPIDALHASLLDLPASFSMEMLNAGETKVIKVASRQIGIMSVDDDPLVVEKAKSTSASLKEEGAELVIVLGALARRTAKKIAALPAVDFVIQGGVDDETPIPPRSSGNGWILHAGRQGQHVGFVDLSFGEGAAWQDVSAWSAEKKRTMLDGEIEDLGLKIAEWESTKKVSPEDLALQKARLVELRSERNKLDSAATRRARSFSMSVIPLSSDVGTDLKVNAWMVAHDKNVNEANRKALADLKPANIKRGEIPYVGSTVCAACHTTQKEWWSGHPHGHAYATLEKRHKEFSLDCVGCHVTGYNQPGGSTVTHNLDGALQNVGCESCHGPGASHVKDPTKKLVLNPPESTCIGCHNEEHSDLFDYQKYRETLIVPGHGKDRPQ